MNFPEKINYKINYVACALVLIFILALIIRLIPYHRVFVNGTVIFFEVDPYYFLRHIMYASSHFPHSMDLDYYNAYPSGGGSAQHVYILAVSAIALIAGSGSPSTYTVEAVTALLPPIVGSLTIFPVYFIGKEIFDSRTGLISALMLSILNVHIFRTIVGYSDHDFLDVFFISMIVLFFLLAIKNVQGLHLDALDKAADLKRALIYSLLSGILISAFVFNWNGAPFFIDIFFVYALIRYSVDRFKNHSSDALFFVGCIIFAMSFFLTGLFLMGSVYFIYDNRWGSSFALVNLLLVFSGFFVPGLISIYMERHRYKWYLFPPITIGTYIIILFGSMLVLKSHIANINEIIYAKFYSTITTGNDYFITEAVSILDTTRVVFADKIPIFIITIGLTYYIFSYFIRKKNTLNIFFISWTLIVTVFPFIQVRFIRLLSINMALLIAFFFSDFYDIIKLKNGVNAININRVLFICMLLVFVIPYINEDLNYVQKTAPMIETRGFYEPLIWLRENTPPTSFYDNSSQVPEYGVMSWPDMGYWITYVGKRPNFANPAQANVDIAARFFSLDNETEANRILESHKLKFVIAYQNRVLDDFIFNNRFTGFGDEYFHDFFSIPQLEGEKNVKILNNRFYNSMYIRMSLFDGTASETPLLDEVEPLKYHRLIYENNPLNKQKVKIFEFVKGARVQGTTHPATAVTASVAIRTNTGRMFDFTEKVVSDESGNFTIILPYSQDAPYETRPTGNYNISAGCDTLKVLRLNESDVINGSIINITLMGPDCSTNKNTETNLSLNVNWVYDTKNGISSFVSTYRDGVYTASRDGIYNIGKDGKLKWKYIMDSEPFPVLNVNIYAATREGSVYAIDPDGHLIWKTDLISDKVYSSPLLHNGILYVGTNHGLYAINITDGRKIWNLSITGSIIATPVITNNTIYVLSRTDHMSELLAIDLKNHNEIWKKNKQIWSSPVLVNNTLIFGTREYAVYGINASDGLEIWTYMAGSLVDSTASFSGNTVYVGSYDRKLHAIGLDNGNRIWKSQSMAPIYAKPVVHDGFIIIGAWDGTLYILGKDTGNIAGKYMTGSEITAPVSVSDKTIFVGTRDGKIYSIQMF